LSCVTVRTNATRSAFLPRHSSPPPPFPSLASCFALHPSSPTSEAMLMRRRPCQFEAHHDPCLSRYILNAAAVGLSLVSPLPLRVFGPSSHSFSSLYAIIFDSSSPSSKRCVLRHTRARAHTHYIQAHAQKHCFYLVISLSLFAPYCDARNFTHLALRQSVV